MKKAEHRIYSFWGWHVLMQWAQKWLIFLWPDVPCSLKRSKTLWRSFLYKRITRGSEQGRQERAERCHIAVWFYLARQTKTQTRATRLHLGTLLKHAQILPPPKLSHLEHTSGKNCKETAWTSWDHTSTWLYIWALSQNYSHPPHT